MLRTGFSAICGVALVLALVSAGAAQSNRPAAWDTRVRNPAPAPAISQDDKDAQEQKDRAKKALNAAGTQKNNKLKPD
jgi:hypothetical protein